MIYSLNQNRFALASGHFTFGTIRFMGLQSLNPTEEVKDEVVRGNGQRGIGFTSGEHSVTLAAEMVLTEYDQLARAAGTPLSKKRFNCSATYLETAGDGIFNLGIEQLKINKVEKKASNDGKAIVVALSMVTTEPIDWNGVKLIEVDEGFDAIGFGLLIG